MPGTDGYVAGTSAAYEKQALLSPPPAPPPASYRPIYVQKTFFTTFLSLIKKPSKCKTYFDKTSATLASLPYPLA